MTFEDDNIDLRSNEFAGRIKCNVSYCDWKISNSSYCWFRTSQKFKAKRYCDIFKYHKELDLF